MSKGYMPNADAEFLAWATNFNSYITAHAADIGVTPGQVASINTAVTSFETSYNAHNTATQSARAACVNKDETRTDSEQAIRSLVRQLQAKPTLTDTEREAMGITVRDPLRTMSISPALNAPVATVDMSKRLVHTMRYWDSQGESRARPEHAAAAEIWIKVTIAGEPTPANPSDFTFLAINSASPFTNTFGDGDGSKTAHYLIRWIAKDGTKGPWSEIISATIAGF